MTSTITDERECLDAEYAETPCAGPVETYWSRSGITESDRCERHQAEQDERMDALGARLQRDYPGWNVPGSSPPDWFDPGYAGESWDEDY